MNNELEITSKIIKNGGIVVFPTETVYGIGGNGLDENVVRRIYEVKQRPLDKPINLLVSDMEMIKKLTKNVSDLEMQIMDKFFPGPLTIILSKSELVPDIVTAGGKTVGIRMPKGEFARNLVKLSGVPLATPSANISGEETGIEISKIKGEFEGKVDYIVDGGDIINGMSSTIVKIENNEIKILREGIISKKDIESAIKQQK